MSFRAGTGYRRPRAAFGIPPCTDAALVVNEAMTAAGVTWAGDRTLAWRQSLRGVKRCRVLANQATRIAERWEQRP